MKQLLTDDSSKTGAGAKTVLPYEGLLEILPPNARLRARGLLYFLLRLVDIAEDGTMIYKGSGKSGSALVDVLKYFTQNNVSTVPHDILPLAELLYQAKVPLSLFAKNKQPTQILTRLQQPAEEKVPEEKKKKWETLF